MAVINRTPDSFFDRGATIGFGPALDAASRAVADGAEIVDIGGVKAGPGDEVTPAIEIDRVAGLVAAHSELHPLPPPEPGSPAHDLDYLTNFERKFRKEGKPIYRMRWERVEVVS